MENPDQIKGITRNRARLTPYDAVTEGKPMREKHNASIKQVNCLFFSRVFSFFVIIYIFFFICFVYNIYF